MTNKTDRKIFQVILTICLSSDSSLRENILSLARALVAVTDQPIGWPENNFESDACAMKDSLSSFFLSERTQHVGPCSVLITSRRYVSCFQTIGPTLTE